MSFDTERFEQIVREKIDDFDRKQTVKFAWLCAVRALPFIGLKGNFDYWEEDKRQEHLYSVLNALDISIALSAALYTDAARSAALYAARSAALSAALSAARYADDALFDALSAARYADAARYAARYADAALSAARYANAARYAARSADAALSAARYVDSSPPPLSQKNLKK